MILAWASPFKYIVITVVYYQESPPPRDDSWLQAHVRLTLLSTIRPIQYTCQG